LLAKIPRKNIQSVPFGYFDNLEGKISLYSLLNQQERKYSFVKEKAGIPSGYFENLPETILSKVRDEESGENFTLLSSLKNNNVFQVPEGYFENLSDMILSSVQPAKKAKVISMTGRKWMKYAVAALIAGVMLLSSLYLFNLSGQNNSPYLAAARQYQTSAQIEAGIASLKDDEIVVYLETHGNIIDNDILLNNINTNELPSEVDYLIDGNTLNNFLEKINKDN
jgi:hypothetical protein